MSQNKDAANEKTPIITTEIVLPAHHAGGLTVCSTIMFLIGELIGVGALALPNSLGRSGYSGIAALFVACSIAIFNGTQLGYCWTILLERYPEYRTHCRYPYAAIGERAVGKWMKYVVAILIAVTCIGTCVLYLLIAAENIHSILDQFGVHLNFCIWMVIFGCLLIPMSWFGSPKDFLWVAVIAFITATTGLILVFANLMVELPPKEFINHQFPTRFSPYFLSYGAILFAFSGASTFPTIQHDMKEPRKFGLALLISYVYACAVYLIIAVSGYYLYGQTVSPNILMSLPNGPLKIAAMSFYVVHLMAAYILFLNPPVQNMEETLRIPNTKCNWRRLLFRTSLVLLILFIAETMPHFGALLDLIGGSSSGFLTFIAPPIFYLRLCKIGYKDSKGYTRFLPLWIKILNVVIICIGIAASCTSTYAAIKRLSSPSSFVPPCYVNSTAAEDSSPYHIYVNGTVG